jgi:SAM-dependent methyltransferase
MFEGSNVERRNVTRELIDSFGLKERVVLDIGAKTGASTKGIHFKEKISIDMDPKVRPSIAVNLNEGIPLKDNSVDVCIAGDVLEHIYKSHKFIRDVHRVLRKNGMVFISVPNIVSLKYRVKFMLGGIPSHAARADSTFPDSNKMGHVRDYSFSELRKLLQKNGFRVMKEVGTGISLGGRIVLPRFIIPRTFGDAVIMAARKSMQRKRI